MPGDAGEVCSAPPSCVTVRTEPPLPPALLVLQSAIKTFSLMVQLFLILPRNEVLPKNDSACLESTNFFQSSLVCCRPRVSCLLLRCLAFLQNE